MPPALTTPPPCTALPMSRAELNEWIRLSMLKSVKRTTLFAALRHFSLPGNLLAQSEQTIARLFGSKFAKAVTAASPADLVEYGARADAWRQHPRHHIVSLADPAYPSRLLTTADPPLLLYVAGRLELLQAPMIAVVGSRNPSQQGRENAGLFAGAIAQAGWSVVSGLALGVDAQAHRAALAHGRADAGTVAVIGTGIDVCYPDAHRDLSAQIAENGALLSEWPIGTPARRSHFPQRNRLIAGLSHGVLVVEATMRSGSLITARIANEIGREVFAIPGSIHSPLARGCHALIKDGAKLVESANDIFDELLPPSVTPSTSSATAPPAVAADAADTLDAADATTCAATLPDDPIAARVLSDLGHDPATPDTLASRGTLDAATIASALVRLEMDGWVEQRGGRYLRTARGGQT